MVARYCALSLFSEKVIRHLFVGVLVAVAVFALPHYAVFAGVKLADEGLAIDAGPLGAYVLTYPVLCDSAQKSVHKRIQVTLAGAMATVRYADGASLVVNVGGTGQVSLEFTGVPSDVKYYVMEMHIDMAFSRGGAWKIGESEGKFPREKPAKPHLYQGNAAGLRITNAQGQSLVLQVPEWSYQQLTDNREWNWPIFAWKSITPYNPDSPRGSLSVGVDVPSGKTVKLVDELGQSTAENWSDKVKSLDELKADVASEAAYYAGLQPPARDEFGGLPGTGAKLGLKKTGFFHVEQQGGKWWLVDPEGNAFFHLGVCAISPSDDYTYIAGRENIYTWLPPRQGEFATAFRPENGGTVLSFHLANQIRKYGAPYNHEAYVARMIERLRKWGFNSGGAFSAISEKSHATARFPYVAHMPINQWEGVTRIPGVRETFDPFDEATRSRIEQNLAQGLPGRAADPLLIGWFIVNEPEYESIGKVVPSLPGKHACKRRFVQFLRDKYRVIDAFKTAWGVEAASFDALIEPGLSVANDAAKADVAGFVQLFLEEYFSFVTNAARRHDPNHLILGSRLQPITIQDESLCRIMGKHVDLVSFNYYTNRLDKQLLRRIHDWTGGKPMVLSEFYWSSPSDSGLIGGGEVRSQTERGLAYRNYVEQAASLGFVVGIEWFTLVDQAATGRWFSKYTGECANTGLLAVTDRPWKPMLVEMMKTNYDIDAVLFGRRPAFAWDDPRFADSTK